VRKIKTIVNFEGRLNLKESLMSNESLSMPGPEILSVAAINGQELPTAGGGRLLVSGNGFGMGHHDQLVVKIGEGELSMTVHIREKCSSKSGITVTCAPQNSAYVLQNQEASNLLGKQTAYSLRQDRPWHLC
jgi:hypothetical protein